MFGVGTDYCLLLVSRYREELQRVEDKHDAMARALRRAGPALLASGCTVITRDARAAAGRRRARSTRSGPSSAIGVAAALLAGLTLLPALLTIVRPSRVLAAQRAPSPTRRTSIPCQRKGIWGALRRARAGAARARARSDGRAVRLLLARPAVLPGGLLDRRLLQEVTSRASTASTSLEQSFPAGALDPTIDPRPARAAARSPPVEVAAVNRRVSAVPGVASVTAAGSARRTARSRRST